MPLLSAYCICILLFALDCARFFSCFCFLNYMSLVIPFPTFHFPRLSVGGNGRNLVQLTLLLEEREKQMKEFLRVVNARS
jgi:hypothetical protein